MLNSSYKSYDDLPLFLNAETVADILGVSLSSAYGLMHEPGFPTMKVGGLVLSEATLSFLGAGVPVTEPSLGMLVKNGFDVLFSGYWWIAVLPGLYIMLLVFGINLLGDFLRDEFNPKLK